MGREKRFVGKSKWYRFGWWVGRLLFWLVLVFVIGSCLWLSFN